MEWHTLYLSLPFQDDPDYRDALIFHLLRYVEKVDITTLDYGCVLVYSTRDTAWQAMVGCPQVRSLGRSYSEGFQAAFMTSRTIVIRKPASEEDDYFMFWEPDVLEGVDVLDT